MITTAATIRSTAFNTCNCCDEPSAELTSDSGLCPDCRFATSGGDYPAYLDAGGDLDRMDWERAGYPADAR